jgi:hypothetical protein
MYMQMKLVPDIPVPDFILAVFRKKFTIGIIDNSGTFTAVVTSINVNLFNDMTTDIDDTSGIFATAGVIDNDGVVHLSEYLRAFSMDPMELSGSGRRCIEGKLSPYL